MQVLPIALMNKLFQLSIIEVRLIFEREINSALDRYKPSKQVSMAAWTTHKNLMMRSEDYHAEQIDWFPLF